MICPLTQGDCLENGCGWWVKLMNDKQERGKCAVAWSSILLVELREAIEKTKNNEPK